MRVDEDSLTSPVPAVTLSAMRHSWPVTLLALVGCARSVHPAPPPGPVPPPARATTPPALPPIPLVEGPLEPRIVYPQPDQLIRARDSNFIFGSVGNGHATLTINGVPVPVHPNGSFLAYLPVPSRDAPRYDLVAVLGADTVRLSQPVRLLPPVPVLASGGPLVVDSSSVTPAGSLALGDEELVRVSVRAPANATVVWRDSLGALAPLVNAAALPGPYPGDSTVRGAVSPRYVGDPEQWATALPARRLRVRSELVISRGSDTVRLALPAVAPPPPPVTWGVLGADSAAESDTDRVITGRPIPGGTYKWLLLPGTMVPVTGWAGEFARVRLDADLEIWVNRSEVRLLPSGASPPRRVAGNAHLERAAGWVDLVIPMAARPPFLVEQGDHTLVLTLYGVTGNTDIITYGPADSLVQLVRWEPVTADRVRYTLTLRTRPYGYLAFWDRGRFVLRVRRPPPVRADRPLAGLTIAVDPGHPPAGATGPTGLYEATATLAVGMEVKALLESRGATVVMTRTTPDPVELRARPIIARRADAEALVSIHLNALPDGVNPFTASGTGTYFFHPQSAPLARALQQEMVRAMGLRDLGVHYDNLALARPTWMPAVLCEGAFIMIPEQEAALRTPEFQRAYARGIVNGLERYFRSLVGEP